MIRLIGLLVVAFVVGAGFSFWLTLSRPSSKASNPVIFTVEEGEGPRTIAEHLRQNQLLVSERPFYVYILLSGKRNRFYPGTYELRPNMTIRQIVGILTDSRQKELAIRVLEGWRITDIAKEVASRTKISQAEFLSAAPVAEHEGYLFPDTYYMTAETTAAEAVKIMRANFDRRTKDLGLTREDVILASIVEREAKLDADRPKVAAVYQNRLKIGMALQADPTVQYAKGSWNPITLADYQAVNSPYNTYLVNGLPPTPISNPGLKSLRAVKEPASHDYYYFFHTNDGSTYYSKTVEEHNANKRKYLQ